MEVKTGYKQTDVGVIPEDWEIRTIGQIFSLVNGRAFKPEDWKDHGLPIIRIQNLNDPNANFNFTTSAVADRHKVKAGDLLFAWSGTLGSSFGARIWRGDEGVLNQHIFKVHGDAHRTTPNFSLVVFQRIETDIAKQAHGFKSSFVHVKKSDLIKLHVPLPPLYEQNAIIEALRDVDELIASLDQLIAKKRDLKQAAMQQLLTGKTRLQGFSGEWETKRLGDALTICHGKSQKHIEDDAGVYPILATGGEIGRTNSYLCEKPSVLIGRKGTIDKPQYLDKPFWTVDTLFYSDIRDPYSAKFIYYAFCMINWRGYNEASGVPSLNARTIEGISFKCPEPAEQTAIAAVLSDMDTELTELEQRRDKTIALKQGMMQELLTGRTRLV